MLHNVTDIWNAKKNFYFEERFQVILGEEKNTHSDMCVLTIGYKEIIFRK